MLVEVEPNLWATVVTLYTAAGNVTSNPDKAAVATVRLETRKGDQYRQIELPQLGFLHSIH